MILFPPAKINLGLNVLRKREDNFHEIRSCMVEISLYDILEILPADQFSFVQTGLSVDGDLESNLCVKAYRIMEREYAVPPIYMHLRKQIPMGAGLGGGSSDATFVLKGLNELFDLKLSDNRLEELAAELGSDCAFFVKGGVQMSEGRGEVLRPFPISLEGLYLKLLYPSVHISTAEAYANVSFHGDCSGYDMLHSNDFSGLVNSFEGYAFARHPKLSEIKRKLRKEGSFHAAMSGSGSAIFGLFKEEPQEDKSSNSWVLKF